MTYMPTPLSESPMRETRHASGKKQFHGEDGRTKAPKQHTDRGVTQNPFLTEQAPQHIGDGMDHAGRQAVSAPIMPKFPLPVSNQEGPELHAQSVSGGPVEAENHGKVWSKGPLGVKHLDPPLTTKKRKALKTSSFALPKKRAYPINDPSHARNALARVSQHGSPAEKATVRAAVRRKYPSIKQGS
jgi:hypothetical protein